MAGIQWIKLKVDMFDNEKIRLIEAMPDADSIIIIWVKLLTYAGKINSSGYIMLTEKIPMNEEHLSTIFNRPLNTVRYALKVFEDFGMIESEDGVIRIANWDLHQNIEGMDKIREQNRLRKQKQRSNDSLKLDVPTEGAMSRDSHVTVTQQNRIDKNRLREEENKDTDEKPSAWESDFEEWWNIYNKKIDKKKVKTIFKRCHKKDGYEAIGKGTLIYLKTVTDKQYQKNPQTFLNAESYNDIEGYEELAKAKANSGMKRSDYEGYERNAEILKQREEQRRKDIDNGDLPF